MEIYHCKIYGWDDSLASVNDYVEDLGICTPEELRSRVDKVRDNNKNPKDESRKDILYFLMNTLYCRNTDLTISPIKMTPQKLLAALLFEKGKPFIMYSERQTGSSTFLLSLLFWNSYFKGEATHFASLNNTLYNMDKRNFRENIVDPTLKLNSMRRMNYVERKDAMFLDDELKSKIYPVLSDTFKNVLLFKSSIPIFLVDSIPAAINNNLDSMERLLENDKISGIIQVDTLDTTEIGERTISLQHIPGINNIEILELLNKCTCVDLKNYSYHEGFYDNKIIIK